MIWAAMNICFFGFLCSGEMCTPSASTFAVVVHVSDQQACGAGM